MNVFTLEYPEGDDRLKRLQSFLHKGASLEIGTGFLKAGTRMPDRNTSAHPRREITLILEGSLTTTAGEETTRLGPGDIVTIPEGENQSSIVHEDTKLLYIFFGEPVEASPEQTGKT